MTAYTQNLIVIVIVASSFSALGAWIGQPVWAALIGGAIGGLIMATEPLAIQFNAKRR